MPTPFSLFGRSSLLVLTSILCIIFLSIPSLYSQTSTPDERLYIPPEISVKVAAGMESIISLAGVTIHDIEGEVIRPEFGTHLEVKDVMRLYPVQLLPILFFDQGSSMIPERYVRLAGSLEADRYVEGEAPSGWKRTSGRETVHPIYYDVLNVIGNRMARYEGSTIQLEAGYTAEPGESSRVGSEREQEVVAYLHDVWGIDTSRMLLLPPRLLADSGANLFRNEEGRRLIIYSEEPALLAPVAYHSHSRQIDSEIGFLVTLDPHTAPDDVSDIELIVAVDDVIMSHTHIAGGDSSIYRFATIWGPPSTLDPKEGLMVQALLHAPDGQIRPSNQVHIPLTFTTDHRPMTVRRPRPGQPVDSFMLGSVPFFEGGNSGIFPWQEVSFRGTIEEWKRVIDSLPDRNYVLECRVVGEPGETALLDIAEQIGYQSGFDEYRRKEELQRENRPKETPMVRFNLESGDPFGTIFSDMNEARTGRQQEQISMDQAERERLSYLNLREGDIPRIDTLLRDRGMAVASVLTAELGIPATSHPDHFPDYQFRRFRGPVLPIHYSPESRFYNRSVEVWLKRQ